MLIEFIMVTVLLEPGRRASITLRVYQAQITSPPLRNGLLSFFFHLDEIVQRFLF